MSNKKDGPRCTVGDDFIGLKKIINDVMMENELYDGYGAYKVSYAATGDKKNKSGLSFGPNQSDMSKRKDSINDFKDILKNAKNNKGELIVKPHEIDIICGENNVNLKLTNKTPEQVFGKNLRLVNAALSSEYGIKKINEVYIRDLDKGIAHIEKAVEYMSPNPAAQAFYSTDYGKTLLFDYHNQFGLNLDGKEAAFINKYINGAANGMKKTDFSTQEQYCARTDYYDFSDHKKYLHSTEQFSKTPTMVDNRLNKTVEILKNKHGIVETIRPLKALPWETDSSYTLDNLASFQYFDDGKQCGFTAKEINLDGVLNKPQGNWQDTHANVDPILSSITKNNTPNIYETACLLNNNPYPLSDNILSNNAYAQTNNFHMDTFSYNLNDSYSIASFTPSYMPPNYNVISNYDWGYSINNYNIGYSPISSSSFNYGGYSFFGSKQEHSSDTFSFKNKNFTLKQYELNEILDTELSSESSNIALLLGSAMNDRIHNVDKEFEASEYRLFDPLKETFEVAQSSY